MKFRNLLFATAFAAPCAFVSAATAQTAASEEEIVVTAQRRAENIQDIPASITAVSGDVLEERGITSAADLRLLVPNVTGGSLRGDTAIGIRGIGLNVTGSSPGVAVHVDGVYQPRPSMADLTQVDVQRAEVLRGPQGTLYGRNANGGVVNFITQAPGDEFGGYLTGSYQSFSESRIQGAVDLPLSDAISVRLTGDRWERGDGFVENVLPGGQDLDKGDSWMARLNLVADISDTFSAQLIATHAERHGPFVYFTNVGQPLADSIAFNPSLATANIPQSPLTTAQNDPADQDRTYDSYALTLNVDPVDGVSFKSITALQRFEDNWAADFDATNVSLAVRTEEQLAETFTQEFTATLENDRVTAILGAFYMHDEFSSRLRFSFPGGARNIAPLGSPAGPPLPPGASLFAFALPYTTENVGLFGDVTIHVTDHFRIFGGVRYSEDNQEITQNNAVLGIPNGSGGFNPIPPTVCNATNRLSFNSTTPRFGVQYDLTPDSMLYASYSQGFKVGGFNYRTGCGANYLPEELTAYEIGSRNQFGALTLNASAFYYDYTDMQVEQLVGLAFILENAEEARSVGLEVEANYRPNDHVTLYGNMAFTEAEFVTFSNVDVLNRVTLPALQDLEGNPLPNAPGFSGNFGFSYETNPILAGGALTFRGDLSYKSRIQFREFDNDADSQEAYALLGASVQWTSPDGRYFVRAFGRNLTDEEYYQGLAQSSLTGTRFVSWGAPRQIGIELRTNF